MCQLSPVSFHGDTIFCIDYHGEPFTPMKPIVENMGLDWAGQFSKLRSHAERWGIENISIPTESGEQEMVTMPVRKLPAYLTTINPRKVKPKLRKKIELYQNESDNALWEYWTKGRAERQAVPENELPATISPAEQSQLHAIVSAKVGMLPREQQRKAYAEAWTRFCRHFRIAKYSQLPSSQMGEAVDYLVNVEWKAAKALPAPQAELPAPAENLPTPMLENAPEALRILHRTRELCRFKMIPKGFSANDREAAERHKLHNDLYMAADNAWAFLWCLHGAMDKLERMM